MQPLTSFTLHIAGIDHPVGQWLCQYIQNTVANCTGSSLHATAHLDKDAERPTYLLVLPRHIEQDLVASQAWLEHAEAQSIPVVLLSSLAVFTVAEDKLWQETDAQYSLAPAAQAFLQLEQQARQNPAHIIVRAGQELSLHNDYGAALLGRMRADAQVSLDDDRFFSPTSADALASVLHAILQQINCNHSLWGTYHCAGVEPVTSFQFAQALLTEAQAYDDLDNITLTALNEGGDSPTHWVPNGDNSLLFHTFGIRPKAWRRSLGRLLKGYFSA